MTEHVASRAHRASLRRSTIIAAAAGGTGLLLLAAACSSSGASGSGAAHGAIGAPVAVPAPATGGYNAAAGSVNGPASTQASGAARTGRLLIANQSIIYTASLTIRTASVGAAAQNASNLATAVGGYVSSEQITTVPGSARQSEISVQLKIPVAAYQTTLSQLESIRGKLIALHSQAVNVTQQVVDVASQVTSTQDAINQLRALLRRAGSVGTLLAVQNEINAEELNLEQLLAQQRVLAHETSYATVSLDLISQHKQIVHHKKQKATGFVAGLKAGWHALVVAVRWVLTAFGAALPIAIVVLLAGGLAWWARRRAVRRRTPPAAAPPAVS